MQLCNLLLYPHKLGLLHILQDLRQSLPLLLWKQLKWWWVGPCCVAMLVSLLTSHGGQRCCRSPGRPAVTQQLQTFIMRGQIAAAALLLLSLQLASGLVVDLSNECPGNLLMNAGFEEPNTETNPTQLYDPSSNPKWGWYEKIPGMSSCMQQPCRGCSNLQASTTTE